MKLLEKLLSINSPSGNEEEIRNFIKDEISDYVDEISIDTLGNLIAKKHSTISHNKIMLTSNMDEPGLIATVIEKKGIARFSLIGKLNENSLLHKKVKFKGNRLGIIFAEKEKDFTLRDMYIDPIGSKIEVGDVAVFEGGSIYIDNEYLCSKAIGNRVGCYILINIIKSLKSCNNDLYFAFTVQEALGSRGAKTAAFSLQPDYAIHVGVTNAYDIPGEQKVKY